MIGKHLLSITAAGVLCFSTLGCDLLAPPAKQGAPRGAGTTVDPGPPADPLAPQDAARISPGMKRSAMESLLGPVTGRSRGRLTVSETRGGGVIETTFRQANWSYWRGDDIVVVAVFDEAGQTVAFASAVSDPPAGRAANRESTPDTTSAGLPPPPPPSASVPGEQAEDGRTRDKGTGRPTRVGRGIFRIWCPEPPQLSVDLPLGGGRTRPRPPPARPKGPREFFGRWEYRESSAGVSLQVLDDRGEVPAYLRASTGNEGCISSMPRQPRASGGSDPPHQEQASPPPPAADVAVPAFKYIPDGCVFLARLRPAVILESELFGRLGPLDRLVSDVDFAEKLLALMPRQIETATVGIGGGPPEDFFMVLEYRSFAPVVKLKGMLIQGGVEKTFGGWKAYVHSRGSRSYDEKTHTTVRGRFGAREVAVCFPDDRTLVVSAPDTLKSTLKRGTEAELPPDWASLWSELNHSRDICFAISPPKMKAQVPMGSAGLRRANAELLEPMELFGLDVAIDDDVHFKVIAVYKTAQAAGSMKALLEAIVSSEVRKPEVPPLLADLRDSFRVQGVGRKVIASGRVPGALLCRTAGASLEASARRDARHERGSIPRALKPHDPSTDTLEQSERTNKVGAALKFRMWSDISGHYMVEAAFVDLVDGQVRLQRKHGPTITIPLERLSKFDQKYVRFVTKQAYW